MSINISKQVGFSTAAFAKAVWRSLSSFSSRSCKRNLSLARKLVKVWIAKVNAQGFSAIGDRMLDKRQPALLFSTLALVAVSFAPAPAGNIR